MTPGSFQDRVLSLVWHQWCELGVPGPHGVRPWVIDPVALAWFTPFLVGPHDARVSGFALGWCAQHGDQVFSASDFTAHAPRVPEIALDDARAWHARLRAGSATGPWPDTDTPPAPVAVETRRMPRRDAAPACVALRARRVWWPPSRADVVLAILSQPKDLPFRAADLEPVGMTRVHLNRILGDLAAAGWLETWSEGRAHIHRLRLRAPLEALLDARDKLWTPWWEVFTVVAHVLHVARDHGVALVHPVPTPPTSGDRDWEAVLVQRVLDATRPAARVLNWQPVLEHATPLASLVQSTRDLLRSVAPDGPRPQYAPPPETP